MTEKQTEALEKLNRGMQESRQEVQQRTMSLAQDYFGDSAELLKQQINEDRAALERIPDQVPGGREEAFQTLFQELMDNYSAMEQCINEARENVANLDTDRIRRQGEVEATDALSMGDGASEESTQQVQDAVEETRQATGQAADSTGQVAQGIQDAVGEAAGQIGQLRDQADGADEDIDASDAAKREAKARGIDLSKVEGTGADGRIVYWDVTELPSQTEGEADPAEQAAQGVSDAASQAAGGAGQAAGGAGQAASQGTSAAVSQTTEQADSAVGQTGGVADQLVEQAVSATRQTADQAGQAAQQGAGNAADQARQSDVAQGGDEEVKVTRAAKRKADEMGVDLSEIQGTGAGGLITIKDVVGA